MSRALALAILAAIALGGCAADISLHPRPTVTAVAGEVVPDFASTTVPDDISGIWYLSGSTDAEMRVTLEPGGWYGGFEGCNWYSGKTWAYGADGVLELDVAVFTLKGCIGEREHFDISRATMAGMSGDELLFFDDAGGIVAAGVRAKP